MTIDIILENKRFFPITLEGIVIPTEWDEFGYHTTIALAADDEKEYAIETINQQGQSLKKLLRKRVRIKGYLKADDLEMKCKAVLVKKYYVINENKT